MMTVPGRLLFLWSFVMLQLFVSSFSPVRAEEPFAQTSFQAACKLALKTKRIVLIDFYTTWCPPCKELDKNTWQDKSVRSWLAKNTISRKIDAEKQVALAEKYKIEAYPTILLLKPNGQEIDRLIGYCKPSEFLSEVKLSLAGHDSVSRAKAKLIGKAKNDPMERMNYARALAEKGRSPEALKELLWCLDEGLKYDQGFYGVRLSFLLGDILELGRQYPPATAALESRRSAARKALENGSGTADTAADYSSYNEAFETQEETLKLYDRLKEQQSPSAKLLFRQVSDQLLANKRYAEFIETVGDVKAYVAMQFDSIGSVLKMMKNDDPGKKSLVQHVVKTNAGYYEALLGLNRMKEAEALRDQALAFAPDPQTYSELIRRAEQAGKPDAAKELRALARKNLKPSEFKKLNQSPEV